MNYSVFMVLICSSISVMASEGLSQHFEKKRNKGSDYKPVYKLENRSHKKKPYDRDCRSDYRSHDRTKLDREESFESTKASENSLQDSEKKPNKGSDYGHDYKFGPQRKHDEKKHERKHEEKPYDRPKLDSKKFSKEGPVRPKEEPVKEEVKKVAGFQFKYDAYTRRRGSPALLSIDCATCDSNIMMYQKDGPGRVLRTYLDRIPFPEKLAALQDNRDLTIKTLPWLKCVCCSTVIGRPMVYQSENRLAFNMYQDKFRITKK